MSGEVFYTPSPERGSSGCLEDLGTVGDLQAVWVVRDSEVAVEGVGGMMRSKNRLSLDVDVVGSPGLAVGRR